MQPLEQVKADLITQNYEQVVCFEEWLEINSSDWNLVWNLRNFNKNVFVGTELIQSLSFENLHELAQDMFSYGPVTSQKILKALEHEWGPTLTIQKLKGIFRELYPIEDDFATLGFFESFDQFCAK